MPNSAVISGTSANSVVYASAPATLRQWSSKKRRSVKRAKRERGPNPQMALMAH